MPGVNLSFCYKANSTNMCDKNTIFEMLSRKKVLFIKRSYVTYVTHHCSNNAFINSQSNFSNFSLTWSKRGIKLNKAQYIIQLCKINPNKQQQQNKSNCFYSFITKKVPPKFIAWYKKISKWSFCVWINQILVISFETKTWDFLTIITPFLLSVN